MDIILKIYQRENTVFTFSEVAQMVPGISDESLRDRLYYFSKIGKIKRLRNGIYAKNSYNPLELANKLYVPSYISLETVLAKEGVIFQYYERIFAVSYLTREVKVEEISIQYRKIGKLILTNTSGLILTNGYFIATLERAFLDAIYIYKDYHFDNLDLINWERVKELVPIYNSKTLSKRVEKYYAKH